MSRYGLIGSLRAHPGQREELLAILKEGAEVVAEVPGCEVYIVSTTPGDEDAVWFMEVWTSEADHKASLADSRIRAIIDRAMPLIAGMGDQVVLEPVIGKGLLAPSRS